MFTDIDETRKDWDAISYVVDANLMGGYLDGSFRPKEGLMWGELYKIIALFLTTEEEIGHSLNHCCGLNHWARRYVDYCRKYGIIQKCTKIKKATLDEHVTSKEFEKVASELAKKLSLSGQIVRDNLRENMLYITRSSVAQTLYALATELNKQDYYKVNEYLQKKMYKEVFQALQAHPTVLFFQSSDVRRACFACKTSEQFAYTMRIRECKQVGFHCSSDRLRISHYTNISALEALSKEGAKFQLSPVAYLNDPEEGALGLREAERFFKDDRYGDLFKNWESTEVQVVFVGSFVSQREESLPMWVHYGDRGCGCIIEFNAYKVWDEVYNVCYKPKCGDKSNGNKFTDFLTKVEVILDEYLDRCIGDDDIKDDPVFLYAKGIIEQVCYLYKTSDYSYENEVRILQLRPIKETKERKCPAQGEVFPRIYSDLTYALPITSITLGPKTSDPEKVRIALACRGIDIKTIRQTTLQYR